VTAHLYDVTVALVVAYCAYKVARHPAPTPRRRHKNVRGTHPALPRERNATSARVPRTPHQHIAGGDEYDLALHRFEQARRRARSWTPDGAA